MEPMSWSEIFNLSSSKGLRDYREENNIITPEEYNISVKRMAVALAVYTGLGMFLIGVLVGTKL